MQQVVSTFLYYARAVDPTMLVALNIIAVEQYKTIDATAKALTQVPNYAAKHSESITRYYASGMILKTHSDASFLSEHGANIRAGGCNYLSLASADPKNPLPSNRHSMDLFILNVQP